MKLESITTCNTALNFGKANSRYKPTLDPFDIVQYILSYDTKQQKGRSVIIECACQEGRNGNMDLKASVRHMAN